MISTSIIISIVLLISILTCKGRPIISSSNGLLSREYTNCLKGIAILLIIIGHISGTMGTVIFSPLGGTGVALFLILSGYGINESYKKNGLHKFWKKKVFRVLLPYSFVFICLAIYNQNFSPVYWTLNLLGLDTAYWYIAFIIRCYIIFWFSSFLLSKYRIWSIAILSIGLFLTGNGLEAPQALSFFTWHNHLKYKQLPPPMYKIQFQLFVIWHHFKLIFNRYLFFSIETDTLYKD